ncbi:hypothetical protein [Mucilaginibacter paludis]|uniref:Uncharacterized protein n=1 Tax=Mucilaginibacter paludis DSM 18603 TaxID=714943 RepID=H1XZF6_9SPHI|nr:hypothetical protein [Mucilaginibacter paludis]EHQ25644.1 hypothetical protein Mucpa_1486 [Mucilaginibacter paludis DSM 18603]
MKISRIAAKVMVRLLLFLVLLALVPFFTGNTMNQQLHEIYIMTNNKWILIFPILLLIGFITLLITCTVQKYTKPDINWLLVLNSVMLIAYGISIYIRLSHLIK